MDRLSMANSLEVRSPLRDSTSVEYMATLPAFLKLRQSVSQHIFQRICYRLPPSVLSKRKQGFAIPGGRWFQSELWTAPEEIMLDPKSLGRSYFRRKTLRQKLRHHTTRRCDYSGWIWCLLALVPWFRRFVEAWPTQVDCAKRR